MASLARTILEEHLERGELVPGQEIALRVDQALAQDATGTMAMMQFELFGEERVRVDTAVVYVDHNILQIDFKNPDDHRFLQAMAAKYGAWFSRPGNGICHYVHCERFAKPGQTLIGADSHTTQSGSCAMIAIGAGGLDVAVCMAGHPFELPCPKIASPVAGDELKYTSVVGGTSVGTGVTTAANVTSTSTDYPVVTFGANASSNALRA